MERHMKKVIGIFTVLVLILSMTAPAWTQSFSPSDAVETVGQGSINWTAGEVYATGIGVPPPTAVNPAQSRAMASRAAQVVAYRNLLEIVKGVRVDSETVVENFMTKSDIIRTRVDGIVKGARIVKTQYMSDGAVEVLVAMPLAGALMDAVVPDSFGAKGTMPLPPPSYKIPSTVEQKQSMPQQRPPAVPPSVQPEKRPEPQKQEPKAQVPQPAPQEKKPEPPKTVQALPATPSSGADQSSAQFKGGKATGIVIDGRGLGLKPALLPKIIDAQGQEIYVGQVVTRTNAVEQGVAGYAKDVNAAANNFRVTDNPAVIRGVKAAGAARTDIVLGQSDANMLRELSKKGDFLQYCRVIIVY
ncbi:MAG: LPP20 family lipoprotein [Nitrospirota bacterium]|nr:LPP20 family lipoprotein [Nitrospirota bacterium]